MKFLNNLCKFGCVTTAFASLMVASAAIAMPMASSHGSVQHGKHTETSSAAYVSIQYYGDFFTHMGDFSGHEDAAGVTTIGSAGYAKDGNPSVHTSPYKPEYETDYLAGGVSLGYAMHGGARIELEGQYANVEVDSDGYLVKDNAKYVELTRGGDISGSAAATNDMLKNWKSSKSITHLNNSNVITKDDHLAAKFTNDGIRFMGAFVNVGYDIPVSSFPISPFVVAGLGFAQTKFLGATEYGLAFQGKVGVAYNLTDEFSIFAAYDYRGSFVKEYKEVALNNGIIKVNASGASATPPQEAVPASTTATVETTFGVHGLMAGVTMKF